MAGCEMLLESAMGTGYQRHMRFCCHSQGTHFEPDAVDRAAGNSCIVGLSHAAGTGRHLLPFDASSAGVATVDQRRLQPPIIETQNKILMMPSGPET